jgi:GNAT superfamily N-acetyltransferase
MPETILGVDLRACELDDVEKVTDLESSIFTDEQTDPARRRHWWVMADKLEKGMRRVAERDGVAIAYTSASHELWEAGEKRFGIIRLLLRADSWSDESYAWLAQVAEEWLRAEGAVTSVARVRQGFERELGALQRLGYREDRRMRMSELDLVVNRSHLLDMRERRRSEMREQGIEMHVLAADPDPDRLHKLYQVVIESEKDIPTTVPWRELTFDEWMSFWFDAPNINEKWFWIAREGDAIVGASVLDMPVVRGIPWTAYTCTSRAVRGRGIASALKYESIGQALELGHERVRTTNDADNAPILRVNHEMGYRLVAPIIELHREL